ncbi:MAG: flagellar hook basal-body protein [Phycisphaerales bacterium]|nr:flagellar hook basal-body protein [Phycisphaerales bacterium]
MNYGLYIATSGALNATYRQDLYTGNLSNMNTVGFKPDFAITRQRDPARVEDDLGYLPSNSMLERLGAGVMSERTKPQFQQGTIRNTGNPYDLAIRGEGFFALLNESDRSLDRLRLTRDGRFTRDPSGRAGLRGRGDAGRGRRWAARRHPRRADPEIGADGTIRQGGVEIAKLQFVEVTNRDELRKGTDGQFIANASQMANRRPATGLIDQGAVEEAAVNEITTLMQIEQASRDVQSNLSMIGYHDRMLDQAINRFAKVT